MNLPGKETDYKVIEGDGPTFIYKHKKTGEYYNMFGEKIKTEDNKTYIYESPDGGKTIYRRESGKHKRVLIKKD